MEWYLQNTNKDHAIESICSENICNNRNENQGILKQKVKELITKRFLLKHC